jgi:hypothetical protein
MKTKIVLHIAEAINHQNLVRIVEAFEKNNFEIIGQFVGMYFSEIPADLINESDYVVSINENVFFHADFFNKVWIYMNKNVNVFGIDEILYTNKDMGVMVAEVPNRVSFFEKIALRVKGFRVLDTYKNMASDVPLVATVLEDVVFLKMSGKFYKERVTAEMLNDGRWGIKA